MQHGGDDQIVPYADSGPRSAELMQNRTLKTYKGFPPGMPTTEAATINADLLEFIQSRWAIRDVAFAPASGIGCDICHIATSRIRIRPQRQPRGVGPG